jgi:hypothetical protein
MSGFYKQYMSKLAEEAPKPARGTDVPTMQPWFTPKPHQEAAVKRLFENDGKMLMVHATGTGKTASSIYGFEKLRHAGKASKAVVITPAGLRTNYADAAKEFTTSSVHVADRPGDVDPKAAYNVVGYETFRQDPIGIMQRTGADTMIVDEYHRIRNEDASTNHALFAGRQYAKNFIGLTASFINNKPAEIAPLLALSENNPALTREDFNAKFVRAAGSLTSFTGKERPRLGIKNERAFVKAVYPSVDFVDTEDVPGNSMPRKQVTNISVPMSDEQYKLYQLALNKLGPISEYITQQDPGVRVRDSDRIFTQIGQARQIANSLHMGRSDVSPEEAAMRTPKVRRLIDDTAKHLSEKPDNNVVLYTNLVQGGIDVVSAGLRKAGIDHALFIGKGTEVDGTNVTEATRQAGVKDFKEGRKRVILISGAGAEGLDLKNATAFYALDGHFNPERVLQAEARARRLGGQAQRPEAQRVVDVRRYQSVAPQSEQPSLFGRMLGRKAPRTTDQWMYDVAGEKYKTNKQFYSALRTPNKYIRKEIAPTGKVRYIYPEEMKQPGFFARMTGAPEAQFKYETPT